MPRVRSSLILYQIESSCNVFVSLVGAGGTGAVELACWQPSVAAILAGIELVGKLISASRTQEIIHCSSLDTRSGGIGQGPGDESEVTPLLPTNRCSGSTVASTIAVSVVEDFLLGVVSDDGVGREQRTRLVGVQRHIILGHLDGIREVRAGAATTSTGPVCFALLKAVPVANKREHPVKPFWA